MEWRCVSQIFFLGIRSCVGRNNLFGKKENGFGDPMEYWPILCVPPHDSSESEILVE